MSNVIDLCPELRGKQEEAEPVVIRVVLPEHGQPSPLGTAFFILACFAVGFMLVTVAMA